MQKQHDGIDTATTSGIDVQVCSIVPVLWKKINKKKHCITFKQKNQPKGIRDGRKMVEKTRNRITYAQRLVKRYEQRQLEGEVDPIFIEDENKNENININ